MSIGLVLITRWQFSIFKACCRTAISHVIYSVSIVFLIVVVAPLVSLLSLLPALPIRRLCRIQLVANGCRRHALGLGHFRTFLCVASERERVHVGFELIGGTS